MRYLDKMRILYPKVEHNIQVFQLVENTFSEKNKNKKNTNPHSLQAQTMGTPGGDTVSNSRLFFQRLILLYRIPTSPPRPATP